MNMKEQDVYIEERIFFSDRVISVENTKVKKSEDGMEKDSHT